MLVCKLLSPAGTNINGKAVTVPELPDRLLLRQVVDAVQERNIKLVRDCDFVFRGNHALLLDADGEAGFEVLPRDLVSVAGGYRLSVDRDAAGRDRQHGDIRGLVDFIPEGLLREVGVFRIIAPVKQQAGKHRVPLRKVPCADGLFAGVRIGGDSHIAGEFDRLRVEAVMLAVRRAVDVCALCIAERDFFAERERVVLVREADTPCLRAERPDADIADLRQQIVAAHFRFRTVTVCPLSAVRADEAFLLRKIRSQLIHAHRHGSVSVAVGVPVTLTVTENASPFLTKTGSGSGTVWYSSCGS